MTSEDAKRELACQVLEQIGFKWDGASWVPPRIDYREVVAQMLQADYKNATLVEDTYLKGKK